MLSGKEINDLLHSLQRMYSQLVTTAWQQRLNVTRKYNSTATEHSLEHPLNEKIKDLYQNRDVAPAVEISTTHIQFTATTTRKPTDSKLDARRAVALQTFNGLSAHFNQSRLEVMPPEVGEKLRKSTWEHLHAAMRWAREGNMKTAMMHAGIANSALKEAARFMPEIAYLELVAQVKAELDALD